MKLYNKFDIIVYFQNQDQAAKVKEKLEAKVDDLEVEFDPNATKEGWYYLKLSCDSGTGMVNGTAFKWDSTDDPEDETVINNFVNFLKDFPL